MEDGSEPEHESESEDPTFDPLQRARDISKLKESSDSNSDSDSERSSEFWDSSDAEKGSLSDDERGSLFDDERGSLFDDEIGDGKTNENHQSENFEIANEKDDDDGKKRHFKSSGGELHEDSKRFKLSTDESPNIDEIDITNDNKDEVSDGLISSTYKVLLFEDIINDRMEGVDDSRADMAGVTAVP